MNRMMTSALAAAMLSAVNLQAQTERTTIMNNKITPQKLELTQEWDKTFPKSGKVNHQIGRASCRERV